MASSALVAPITRAFVPAIEAFVRRESVPVISFRKGQRQNDVAADYHAWFRHKEGAYLVRKAQENLTVIGTRKRRHPATRQSFPSL